MNGLRLAGYGKKPVSNIEYNPTTRRVKAGSFNVVEAVRSYFTANNGFIGAISKASESASDFLNGITTMTYVVGSQSIDIKMTSIEEKKVYILEDAVKRAVCSRDFGISESEMHERVSLDLNLNVWIDGKVLVPADEKGVKEAVKTLRNYMNGIVKDNFKRVLTEKGEEISKLPSVVGKVRAFNQLVANIKEDTETDGAGNLKLGAIVLGDKTVPRRSTSVGDFKTMLFNAGITRDDGTADSPEIEKLHKLLCKINDIPEEDKSYSSLMKNFMDKSKKELSGFLGIKTFTHRTARKFERLSKNIKRIFDPTIRTPGEIFQKRAELERNAAELKDGIIMDFEAHDRGDTVTQSIVRPAPGSKEHERCEKFNEHRGAKFIVQAIKLHYRDLYIAFVENEDDKAGQKAALLKAYTHLMGLNKSSGVNPYANKSDIDPKGFILEVLAYVVPQAGKRSVYLEFLNDMDIKTVKVDQLDQAEFVQRQLVDRRRSLEDDTRSLFEKCILRKEKPGKFDPV